MCGTSLRMQKGRAIILTTHSMKETYILSNWIGIMAKGTLHCIGTSIHLKSKFGEIYMLQEVFQSLIAWFGNSSSGLREAHINNYTSPKLWLQVDQCFNAHSGVCPLPWFQFVHLKYQLASFMECVIRIIARPIFAFLDPYRLSAQC